MSEFQLMPMKSGVGAKYPTFEDANKDKSLLKKIPSRWKKSVGALACIGLLGSTAFLGGCSFMFRGCACDCGSVHFGGSGVPLYVVQLTEQEAVEVIQNKAEHMGLDLRGTPPNVSVTVGTGQWNQRTIAPMLFDEENNIALAHVGVTDRWDWWGDPETARLAQEAFDEKEGDLNVGVFYSRGEGVWCKSRNDQVREDLKQHLSAQVREFIENLQAQGII